MGQGASQLPIQPCSTSGHDNHEKGGAIPQDRVRLHPGLDPAEPLGSKMPSLSDQAPPGPGEEKWTVNFYERAKARTLMSLRHAALTSRIYSDQHFAVLPFPGADSGPSSSPHPKVQPPPSSWAPWTSEPLQLRPTAVAALDLKRRQSRPRPSLMLKSQHLTVDTHLSLLFMLPLKQTWEEAE